MVALPLLLGLYSGLSLNNVIHVTLQIIVYYCKRKSLLERFANERRSVNKTGSERTVAKSLKQP
jgi:hypothetical protein